MKNGSSDTTATFFTKPDQEKSQVPVTNAPTIRDKGLRHDERTMYEPNLTRTLAFLRSPATPHFDVHAAAGDVVVPAAGDRHVLDDLVLGEEIQHGFRDVVRVTTPAIGATSGDRDADRSVAQASGGRAPSPRH